MGKGFAHDAQKINGRSAEVSVHDDDISSQERLVAECPSGKQ
jgi:hypothetical protein